jgi:ketosteroid isomerase-like protein
MTQNVQLVLEILKNEVDGDVAAALTKMSSDYTMTWMYQKGNEYFPKTTPHIESELDDAYIIRGRKYDIRNIAENENLVMVEMIESYPDPETGQMYRTPQVIVLELENGKIRTGRHYCDPRLSLANLSEEEINHTLERTPTKIIVE